MAEHNRSSFKVGQLVCLRPRWCVMLCETHGTYENQVLLPQMLCVQGNIKAVGDQICIYGKINNNVQPITCPFLSRLWMLVYNILEFGCCNYLLHSSPENFLLGHLQNLSVIHFQVSASDVTLTDRWLKVLCIRRTTLETLQKF